MFLPFVIAVAGFLPALADPPAAPRTSEDLERTVGLYYGSTAIDEDAARSVSGVTLKQDIATIRLERGTLYPTAPLDGVVAGAVFVGEGSFTLEPIRKMDALTLRIASSEHLGTAMTAPMTVAFDRMFIVSLDATLEGILAMASPAPPGAGIDVARGILRDRMHVLDAQEKILDLRLAEKLLGRDDGPLLLHFRTADSGWLVFENDPRATYELQFGGLEEVGRFHEPRPLVVTHRSGDLDPAGGCIADPIKDQKDSIDITRYVMDITIPDTKHITVQAEVHFTPLIDGLRVVGFDLVNNIAGVRSDETAKPVYLRKVTEADGTDLAFVHRKNQALVLPASPLSAGREYVWRFSLDEETIVQLSSVHYLMLNTYAWYPQHGFFGGRAALDWTIRTRKPLTATGSGRLAEAMSEDGYNVSHLTFDQDVAFASLIFGQYRSESDRYAPDPGGTPVDLSVFYWPRTEYFIFDDDRGSPPESVEVTVPSGKPKDVLKEAADILKFYEDIYGPFPYRQLNVAQMAPGLGFGQAPPGFIQLTGEAFMSSAMLANFSGFNADFFHEFFSHEAAHQYFGHLIEAASLEDVWLHESFAEYTAGLYVMGLLGQDRFQGKLKEWRDMARIADPHGPIAWASNISGQNAQTYAIGLLYNKGPYVVHMLRMQIGHDNYVKAMRNLFTKHRFQQITTDMFRREVEEVVGYKLDYFFDQWYRGVGIPVFDFATEVRENEDGKWLATIRISQRDKENHKVVLMPIFFHFPGGKVVVQNRPILGPEDVYQVRLPQKPDRISLDDYNTLLADIVPQGAASF